MTSHCAGYKYNETEHPECAVAMCDRGTYPNLEQVIDNVSGFKGVTQRKYGKASGIDEED